MHTYTNIPSLKVLHDKNPRIPKRDLQDDNNKIKKSQEGKKQLTKTPVGIENFPPAKTNPRKTALSIVRLRQKNQNCPTPTQTHYVFLFFHHQAIPH